MSGNYSAELESLESYDYSSEDEDEEEDTSPRAPTFEEAFAKARGIGSGGLTKEAMFAKIPEPPLIIHSLARDETSASVWFDFDFAPYSNKINEITGWEIIRYKRDNARNIWYKKGSYHIFAQEVHLKQYVIPNLQEGIMYKFSVCAINIRGQSMESALSNAIMLEKPLPSGWFRFYHASSERFYYSNIKIRQSSWKRPELDPYFVDETVLLQMGKHEIDHLRSIYDYEIHDNNVITIKRFKIILQDLGMKITESFLREMTERCTFHRVYLPNNNVVYGIMSFQEYLIVILAIRRTLQDQRFSARIKRFFNTPRRVYMNLRAQFYKDERYGHWVKKSHPLVPNKMYWVNSLSNESCWSMPDQVRFFLPESLSKQLLVFSPGELEQFKYRFACLDLDGDGSLDQPEIKILISSLIRTGITQRRLHKLIKEADVDGNGLLTFDEFCILMLRIRTEIIKNEKKSNKHNSQNEKKILEDEIFPTSRDSSIHKHNTLNTNSIVFDHDMHNNKGEKVDMLDFKNNFSQTITPASGDNTNVDTDDDMIMLGPEEDEDEKEDCLHLDNSSTAVVKTISKSNLMSTALTERREIDITLCQDINQPPIFPTTTSPQYDYENVKGSKSSNQTGEQMRTDLVSDFPRASYREKGLGIEREKDSFLASAFEGMEDISNVHFEHLRPKTVPHTGKKKRKANMHKCGNRFLSCMPRRIAKFFRNAASVFAEKDEDHPDMCLCYQCTMGKNASVQTDKDNAGNG